MSQKLWTRRDLLRLGLGTAATCALFEGAGHLYPWIAGTRAPNSPLLTTDWSVADSFRILQNMGKKNSQMQMAALLRLQQACADDSENDWTIITVRVFDQVHPPLVFALGELDENKTQVKTIAVSDDQHPALYKMKTSTRTYLANNGIKNLCQNERFRNLRLNEWFGSRLYYGTVDGKPKMGGIPSTNAFDYSNHVGSFPDNVALQAGVCLNITSDIPVHQLKHAKLGPELPDLNHFAGLNLVKSPLGITCFMMGGQYDANGGPNNNQIFKDFSSSEATDVPGRSLTSIVRNMSQSLQTGFGDDRTEDQNLTLLFDELMVANPKMRRSLFASQAAVKDALLSMKVLSLLETSVLRSLVTEEANLQAELNFGGLVAANAAAEDSKGVYTEGPARQEFLSHCAYVAEALKIQGRPYRNFSLFLNLNDLDGQDMDESKNKNFRFEARSLNYIEGMRQLAMGMNILANGIAGKRALVVVISDGARGGAMSDGEKGNSFAFVMGPKETGLLDDALHGPESMINLDYTKSIKRVKRDSDGKPIGEESVLYSEAAKGFGDLNENTEWTTGGTDWGYFSASGVRLQNARPTVGDWQVGVLEFLGQVTGKSYSETPNNGIQSLGNYVRFKRKKA